jgi:hypothetical protein
VAILSLLVIKLPICCVVDVALKVRTSEKVLDDIARVPIPNVVPRSLPLGRTGCFGERTVILQVGVLPLDIANLDCIDLAMEISVVGDGRRVTVGNERGGTQFEELVDLSP